jgi:hypothetical protein
VAFCAEEKRYLQNLSAAAAIATLAPRMASAEQKPKPTFNELFTAAMK